MKLVVMMKQVPDNTKLRIQDDGPVLEGASMMMNPYDEYALETALRLRDALKEKAGTEATVCAMSLGPATARETLKKAIAIGADEAIHIDDPALTGGDHRAIARTLAKAIETQVPDAAMVLFGQMSLDDASSQTGASVAELLGRPSLNAAKLVEVVDANTLHVTRETERGIEKHELSLPAVVSMMKCDYELRASNIKGVMKANKTSIPVKTLADLGLATDAVGAAANAVQRVKTWKKPPKSEGRRVEGVDAKQAAQEVATFLESIKAL